MSKGVNKLLAKRNEMLLRRWYYWTEIQRIRFDDALKILSEQEFFLSQERIMVLLRENCDKLKDIKVKPAPKVRRKRWKESVEQLSLFPK